MGWRREGAVGVGEGGSGNLVSWAAGKDTGAEVMYRKRAGGVARDAVGYACCGVHGGREGSSTAHRRQRSPASTENLYSSRPLHTSLAPKGRRAMRQQKPLLPTSQDLEM